jgi:small subunit ribosomal protein S4
MARYTGPDCKLCRREGIKLYLKGERCMTKKCAIERRQFRKTFAEASRRPGRTGEILLRYLELRLDNVVYRLGFAANREQARQLVTHGHFEVNGVTTNIPSYRVRVSDTIRVRNRSRNLTYFKDVADTLRQRPVPQWLSLQGDTLSGSVLALPERADSDQSVREQLIVEYYSRRV